MTQKASVRMEEIRRRTRRLRQRRAHRINCALSAVCLFLTVGIASLLFKIGTGLLIIFGVNFF